jgi:hypothetical protein
VLRRWRRSAALVVALSFVVPALASLPLSSPAVADSDEVGMCADGGPRPCVVSVLRNGEPAGDGWSFSARYTDQPSYSAVFVSFNAMHDGDFDLGFDSLDDTWQVTLDLGTVVARSVRGHAQDATVERGSGTVTVTGRPVTVSGQCGGNWDCPEWGDDPDPENNAQWDGDFDFLVSELPFEETELLDVSDGFDYFTNVAATSAVPEIRHDDETGSDYLWWRMANRHYYEDGTTVVHGRLEVRIPNQLLRVIYGIPNPETMTADSLDPVVTGHGNGSGTISVSQEAGADAMLVRIQDVTFSRRTAQLRLGVIVPTRPRHVVGVRSWATHALVDFDRARPRGAKVAGHQVRCLPARGSSDPVVARGKAPVTVSNLVRGTPYDCRVRGLSKAGPGRWSGPVRLADGS